MALERFFVDQVVSIFKNDNELTEAFVAAGFSLVNGIYPLYDSQYYDLAELLLESNAEIQSKTVSELSSESFLMGEISSIISYSLSSTGRLYKQIFYTFKYSAVKIFFRKNYDRFLPEYDIYQIKDGSKKQLLFEAFVRELDRFSLIIDNIYNLPDINKIPENYLNYLAQVIGYDRKDYFLLTNATFRELLKNIIEIYQIKGTNYSFELFLNFLGFDVTIQEFWFDKRYYDDNIFTNPYTSSTNKDLYTFYLTPIKPTLGIPSGIKNRYTVTEDMITGALDLHQFQKWISLNEGDSSKGYTLEQLLGFSSGYDDAPYEFFKTNVMQYQLISLGTNQEPELTSDDTTIIEFYVEFLTPLFIEKKVVFAARPYEEEMKNFNLMEFNRLIPQPDNSFIEINGTFIREMDAGSWGEDTGSGDTRNEGEYTQATITLADASNTIYNYLTKNRVSYIYLHTGDTNEGMYRVDFSYTSGAIVNNVVKDGNRTKVTLERPFVAPASFNQTGDSISIGKLESMFHLFEGLYPVNGRFWEGDSLMTYADVGEADPGDGSATIPNSPLKYGGHWISGFYTNTYTLMYDQSNPSSVYNYFKNLYPTHSHDKILQLIADRMSGDTLFRLYSTYGVSSRDLIPPLRQSLSIEDDFSEEDEIKARTVTYGMNFSYEPFSFYRASEGLPGPTGDSEIYCLITKVDKEINGDQSQIYVYDPTYRFRYLQGDTGDTYPDYIEIFNMPYAQKDQEGIWPVNGIYKEGDTGDTTIITLGDTLGAIDGDTGGLVQVYLGRDWQYGDSLPFIFDRILVEQD